MKVRNRVVGDYEDPGVTRPATWAKVPAASSALSKLARLVASSGTVHYAYADEKVYDTI